MANMSSPQLSTSSQVQRGKRKRKIDCAGPDGVEDFPSGSHQENRKRSHVEQQPEEHLVLRPEEWEAFYSILEEDYIQDFLSRDYCLRISDKYLLSMVLVYFIRAGLKSEEYRKHFFAALVLANTMEEDEFFRRSIYPWALGWRWRQKKDRLHQKRDLLLVRMGFRARVHRATCDLIMANNPTYWAWTRTRREHHGWATRWFMRSLDERVIRGPGTTFFYCLLCNTSEHHLSCR